MNDQKDPKEQEMVKYGVACSCSQGDRPEELEKTGEAGKLKCPHCGQLWLDTGTDKISSYKQS